MSFDGRSHRGYQLAGPVYTHSNACSAGNGPSIALAQGYCFGQTQARRIGEQTYRLHLDTPGIYVQNAQEIEATTWVSVGRFKRYIPTHATHALFDFWGSVTGGESVITYARIRVTDLTNNIDGDAVSLTLDARSQQDLDSGSETSRTVATRALSELTALASYGGSALVHLRGGIQLALPLVWGQAIEVNVEAYSVDADTEATAMPLHPYIACSWWEVA